MNSNRNSFIKDLSWYLIGSAIPMIVGFFRVPIFTRYFSPEEYGVYGIVYITYFILSIFLFNWLTNCIWRFYNEYKRNNSLNILYSNLFLLHLCFSFILLIVALIWTKTSTDDMTKSLTLLVFGQLLFNSVNNYILVIFRLEGKTAIFNVINILRAVLSFGLQVILTFIYKFRIEAIPISMLLVELIILPIILFLFLEENRIIFSNFSKSTIRVLFNFSLPSIFSNLGLYILTSSDRYIIALFNDMEKVGIYNQVYNLCQISMMAIINLFFAIINPSFMRELSNHLKTASRRTSNYLSVFILLITPIAVYFSIYGETIANIMLGKEFRTGNTMIPWLMLSVFIYGLTLFPENRLKFASDYRSIIIGFITCAVLNIIINFITIPIFTYKWASISTFISYFCLMLYFYYIDLKRNYYTFSGFRTIFSVLLFLIVEVSLHFIIKYNKSGKLSISENILEGGILLSLYIFYIVVFHRKTLILFVRIYN